jgi:hypothetical protein
MCPACLRRSITTGTEPKISITENRISVTEIISLKFNMAGFRIGLQVTNWKAYESEYVVRNIFENRNPLKLK